MTDRSGRREFLAELGRGMLVASLGPALADDLGLARVATAADVADRLTFGAMEPLVGLMEDTPVDRLLPAVVARIKAGADLRDLVAAAALANARAFGGQDYDGYHAIMALVPSYYMASETQGPLRALPVLKVLYRNTAHIQRKDAHSHEALHAVAPAGLTAGLPSHTTLLEATRRQDMDAAERTFAAMARGPLDLAFNDLQYVVQDYVDVHRVVLAWRSWALIDFAGKEHAHTLLRQSVRFCVDEERALRQRPNAGEAELRALLPGLIDRLDVSERSAGNRRPDDAWLDRMCHTIYSSRRDQAARAVAEALGEGIAPEAVGEAISLAANQLVLHDPGRRQADSPAKPKGSVHGASVGVHASDAANAWRNISRVSDRRNVHASLIVGAYHTAGQTNGLDPRPYPFAEHVEKVRGLRPHALLPEIESAITSGDQARATALVHRSGELSLAARPIFDLMRRFATSEDGALHAEKYYRTVVEEFETTRPAFRWRHLAALARVTASEYGHPAPGLDEARRLLSPA